LIIGAQAPIVAYRQVRRWLPEREIKLMGQTASTILELGLHAKAQRVTLVTTGRLDAVLHEPPPARTQQTSARPRVVGQRLPSLEPVLQNPQTAWQKLPLDWYGEGARTHRRVLKPIGKRREERENIGLLW